MQGLTDTQNLTEHPEVVKITDKIKKRAEEKPYLVSDIILRENGFEYQFVDLVLEGGGTLGIALVGYIHALEQAGVRFLGMGGSSVGALVALLAYSCGDRMTAKGEKLAAIIGKMNLGELVDGKYPAKKLSKLLGKRDARLKGLRTFISGLFSLKSIFKKIGLNPGDELLGWISDRLAENGIKTLDDLNKRTKLPPGKLIYRDTLETVADYDTQLKIVAADITTSTKVVFPEMAAMYWPNPGEVNPACFARASVSIPLFFQPFTVSGISQIIESSEKWETLGNFTGDLPDKISFADGGLFSNFPIDLFDGDDVPKAPTLGARLGNKNRTVKEIDTLGQYAEKLFNSLRHYADFDFIFKHPLYKRLIAHIPTNKYHWLDFNMSPEDKLGLFCAGVNSGYEFLEKFDWGKYKELRKAELAGRKMQSNIEKI